MIRAYKYELCPTEEQQVLLAKHFGANRFVYNWALDKKQKYYEQHKESLSCYDLMKELTQLKKDTNFEWLKEINSQSLQQSLAHLDVAFYNFFKGKARFPKFKSKHKSRQSYSNPQGVKIDFEKYLLFLPKFGWVKFYQDRHFEGTIKTCFVSKTPTGRVYASVLVETGQTLPAKCIPLFEQTVGVDLGIKDFAVISSGEKVANPRILKQQERKLKIAQQRLSRKQKGSKNYQDQKFSVAKIHEKLGFQRKDFQHKLSTRLIRENQAIAVENLNVAGMLQNHKLAKHISDAAWAQFGSYLNYKAEWQGKYFVKIGRFEPSSKLCSVCGWMKQDLTLKDREWTCESCGTKHDRDVNAAQNIRKFGWTALCKNLKLGDEGNASSINKARYSDTALVVSDDSENPRNLFRGVVSIRKGHTLLTNSICSY